MKNETKELVQWITTILNEHKRMLSELGGPVDAYDDKRRQAIRFLDSLPEIESHLCNGGYIQDINGTPCCDGDKVMFKNITGELCWSNVYSKFFVKYTISNKDGCYDNVSSFFRKDIEKVIE